MKTKIYIAEVFDEDSNAWVVSQAFDNKDDAQDYIDYRVAEFNDYDEYRIVEKITLIKEVL